MKESKRESEKEIASFTFLNSNLTNFFTQTGKKTFPIDPQQNGLLTDGRKGLSASFLYQL